MIVLSDYIGPSDTNIYGRLLCTFIVRLALKKTADRRSNMI